MLRPRRFITTSAERSCSTGAPAVRSSSRRLDRRAGTPAHQRESKRRTRESVPPGAHRRPETPGSRLRPARRTGRERAYHARNRSGDGRLSVLRLPGSQSAPAPARAFLRRLSASKESRAASVPGVYRIVAKGREALGRLRAASAGGTPPERGGNGRQHTGARG